MSENIQPSGDKVKVACGLTDLGFSVHWLRPRSKAPLLKGWAQVPALTKWQLTNSFNPEYNIGVRCGAWSKGLVVLDVDVREAHAWRGAIDSVESLVPDHMYIPVVESGGPFRGRHYWFKVTGRVLPEKAATTILEREGWKIELLSTGKNLVVPPSVHPDTGREYRWLAPIHGELPELPDEIYEMARPKPKAKVSVPRKASVPALLSWKELLEPHGWRVHSSKGSVTYWTRPQKDNGVSASTDYRGDLFYVFTSSAPPFEPDRGYSSMAVYAILFHGGDYGKAMREVIRHF